MRATFTAASAARRRSDQHQWRRHGQRRAVRHGVRLASAQGEAASAQWRHQRPRPAIRRRSATPLRDCRVQRRRWRNGGTTSGVTAAKSAGRAQSRSVSVASAVEDGRHGERTIAGDARMTRWPAGVFLQSLGGGGGNGGMNISGGLSLAKSARAARLPSAWVDSAAAAVMPRRVNRRGDRAGRHDRRSSPHRRVLAQSVGAAGGNGGMNISGAVQFSNGNLRVGGAWPRWIRRRWRQQRSRRSHAHRRDDDHGANADGVSSRSPSAVAAATVE